MSPFTRFSPIETSFFGFPGLLDLLGLAWVAPRPGAGRRASLSDPGASIPYPGAACANRAANGAEAPGAGFAAERDPSPGLFPMGERLDGHPHHKMLRNLCIWHSTLV